METRCNFKKGYWLKIVKPQRAWHPSIKKGDIAIFEGYEGKDEDGERYIRIRMISGKCKNRICLHYAWRYRQLSKDEYYMERL